jgi:hypothetical protein
MDDTLEAIAIAAVVISVFLCSLSYLSFLKV